MHGQWSAAAGLQALLGESLIVQCRMHVQVCQERQGLFLPRGHAWQCPPGAPLAAPSEARDSALAGIQKLLIYLPIQAEIPYLLRALLDDSIESFGLRPRQASFATSAPTRCSAGRLPRR